MESEKECIEMEIEEGNAHSDAKHDCTITTDIETCKNKEEDDKGNEVEMETGKGEGNGDDSLDSQVPSGYHCTITKTDHTNVIVGLSYSFDGLLLASCSADRRSLIYDSQTGELLQTLGGKGGHELGINACIWVDSNILLTASDDKTIKVWDVEYGKVLSTLEGNRHFVYSLTFNPMNRAVVSGCSDGMVKVFDLITGKSHLSIEAHSDVVTTCDFNISGKEFVTGALDGIVRVWEASSGACLRSINGENTPPISCVKHSPAGEYLFVSTLDDAHRLYSNVDPEEHGLLREYRGHRNRKYSIQTDVLPTISPNGPSGFVSGSDDNNVYIWDVNQREPVHILKGHSDSTLAVASNPNSSIHQIASAGKDRSLKFWCYKECT